MTVGGAAPVSVELIPPAEREEWLALSAAVDASGAVPCRTGEPEAWWPDRKQLNSPATHGAMAGCHRCAVEVASLAYAIAADERFGVSGGRLPMSGHPGPGWRTSAWTAAGVLQADLQDIKSETSKPPRRL